MIEILISLISGIVSGLGMGGGTILIFLLSNIIKIEQHTAQATNLIFFIPTSIMAIIINLKIATNINVFILRKYFGIFLAIIAINEIYSIVKNHKKEYEKQKSK